METDENGGSGIHPDSITLSPDSDEAEEIFPDFAVPTDSDSNDEVEEILPNAEIPRTQMELFQIPDRYDYEQSFKKSLPEDPRSTEELNDELKSLLRATEPDFFDYAKFDNEEEVIFPLETENGVSRSIPEEMKCYICNTTFTNKIRYIIHKRRHFAMDHFKCPVCCKGFTSLPRCQAHEFKEHTGQEREDEIDRMKEIISVDEDENDSTGERNWNSELNQVEKDEIMVMDNSPYAFRSRNARRCNYIQNEVLQAIEEVDDTVEIVPSTCLYPYKGPELRQPFEQYHIELNYGRQRKTHARVQAKHTIETQRQVKRDLEARLAEIQRRRAEKLALDGIENTHTIQISDRSRSRPTNRRSHQSDPDDPAIKGHFCSICGKLSATEQGIRQHQEKYHPETTFRDVHQILRCYSPNSTDDNYNLQQSTKSSQQTSSKKQPQSSSQSQKSLLRKQRQEERQRLKEIELFRKRPDYSRVWEKPDEFSSTPSQEEFLLALNLVPKNDVVLERRAHQKVISSSILRRRERELSPTPLVDKSLRIQMEKLPQSEPEFTHNKYFLCDFKKSCQYFSDSKSEVREHRRSTHFTGLRQNKSNKDYDENLRNNLNSNAAPSSTKSTQQLQRTNRRIQQYESCAHCGTKFRDPTDLALHNEIHAVNYSVQIPRLPDELLARANVVVATAPPPRPPEPEVIDIGDDDSDEGNEGSSVTLPGSICPRIKRVKVT